MAPSAGRRRNGSPAILVRGQRAAPPSSSPAFLSLAPQAQPEWLKVISDMEADIGSNLRWGCAAAGKPRPTVRWLRNGEPLTSQVGDLGLPTHQLSSAHLVPSPSRLPHGAVPLAASLGP